MSRVRPSIKNAGMHIELWNCHQEPLPPLSYPDLCRASVGCSGLILTRDANIGPMLRHVQLFVGQKLGAYWAAFGLSSFLEAKRNQSKPDKSNKGYYYSWYV